MSARTSRAAFVWAMNMSSSVLGSNVQQHGARRQIHQHLVDEINCDQVNLLCIRQAIHPPTYCTCYLTLA
jgi:hypothetical protein